MFTMDPGVAVFVFLAIGAIALFSFLAVAAWAGSRSSERIAYYKNETIKKIADAPGSGGETALAYLREQNRHAALKKRQGLQLGGLVTVAVGIGLMVFFKATVHDAPVYTLGFIPFLIGVALLIYGYVLAPKE